jgi:hypothetical protein
MSSLRLTQKLSQRNGFDSAAAAANRDAADDDARTERAYSAGNGRQSGVGRSSADEEFEEISEKILDQNSDGNDESLRKRNERDYSVDVEQAENYGGKAGENGFEEDNARRILKAKRRFFD